MTEQEKKILFQAICESLSYGLKCTTKAQGWPGVYPICGCIGNKIILDCPKEVEGDDIWLVQNIIPYLRPMSSMTEDEKKEFKKQFGFELHINEIWGDSVIWNSGSSDEYIDVEFELVDINLISVWLDKKMFDWRRIKRGNKRISMIKAGLALEAPEGMYKF